MKRVNINQKKDKFILSLFDGMGKVKKQEFETIGIAIDWCLSHRLEIIKIYYEGKLYTYEEFKNVFIEFFI